MNNARYCLIVEDHAEARLWLQHAVEEAFETRIELAGTLAQGRESILRELPFLALIDLGLPDGSGLALIRHLDDLRQSTATPVTIVVSTVMNDDDSIFTAIKCGADGYILKEESREDLVDMLRGIQQNRPPLSPQIAVRLLGHFREKPQDGLLAPREKQVLQLLAKGFTVPKVAEMLGITYNTAAGYVKAIYTKLNINTRAEATLEASRRGLV